MAGCMSTPFKTTVATEGIRALLHFLACTILAKSSAHSQALEKLQYCSRRTKAYTQYSFALCYGNNGMA